MRTGKRARQYAIVLAAMLSTPASAVTYWNVFNIEGENSVSAAIATYATLGDMMSDTNRTGVVEAKGSVLFGQNIVGSGSDGTTYWNVFNVEGENSLDAAFATYGTLGDMMSDTNRTGVVEASGSGLFGRNIVGSGSDGTTYWNVFNVEGENSLNAAFATYSTLGDMMSDTNRTGVVEATGSGIFGRNIVGSGSTILRLSAPVPEPGTWLMLVLGFGILGAALRRDRLRPSGVRRVLA